MERLRQGISQVLTVLLVVQGMALVVLISVSVFYRYVLAAALSWPDEVAGIVFVWFTLLGVALLVSENAHIAFEIVESFTPPVVTWLLRLLTHAIVILYAAFMLLYGWQYMQMFPFETSPAAGIDLTWLKSAVPVAGGLILVFSLMNIVDLFRVRPWAGERGGRP